MVPMSLSRLCVSPGRWAIQGLWSVESLPTVIATAAIAMRAHAAPSCLSALVRSAVVRNAMCQCQTRGLITGRRNRRADRANCRRRTSKTEPINDSIRARAHRARPKHLKPAGSSRATPLQMMRGVFWWYSLRLAHQNIHHFHHLEPRFQVRFSASQSHISPLRCSLACTIAKSDVSRRF